MFKYLLAAFLALLGLWIYKRSTNRWGLPQTGFNWPLVGQLLELGKTGSNVAYFSKYASQFKGLYVTPLWGENVVVISGAAALNTLNTIERKGHLQQWTPPTFEKLFRPVERTYESHALFRKILTPPLSRSNLENMGIFKTMEPIFNRTLTRKIIDNNWIRETTFEIAWLLNIGHYGSEYEEEAEKAYRTFSLGLRTHQYSKDFKEALVASKIIGSIVQRVMDEHPESLIENPDALLPVYNTIIEEDYKDRKEKLTKDVKIQELGSLLVGLLFASHDTLSKSYHGILWNLVNNPNILKRLDEECNNVNPPQKATDLDESDYVNHFVKEVLRLSGGGGGFRKCVNEPIQFSKDLTFSVGTKFFFLEAFDHCNVKNHDTFDPERKDEYKWAPFGGGQHNCLGRHFAIMQLKYFLYHLFHNYTVKAVAASEAHFKRSQAVGCHLEVIPKRTTQI